jgi:diguanylate cyclase (GGDEF)-like protein
VRAAACAALLAFAALVVFHTGSSRAWTAFDNGGEALVALAATVACASRARSERRSGAPDGQGERTFLPWLALALGCGAWTLGQTGWTVYEAVTMKAGPEFSVLDAAFLAFPVLAIRGLLAMVRTPAGRLSQLRGIAEGLFIAAGFFLLAWSLVIASMIAQTHASTLDEVVNLAYPSLDAVALAAALFVALRRREDPPPGLGMLGAGIACIALSDSLYWYESTVRPNGQEPAVLGLGWLFGFALIALAALSTHSRHGRGRRLAGGRTLLVAPVLPAAGGMASVAVALLAGGSLGPTGAVLAIVSAIVLLALFLLVSVGYEDRAVTGELERRVRDQLREQAFRDPLTGLSNRALLSDRAAQAFARVRRTGGQVAVIAIDLDAFAPINDRFGHEFGDELLRTVAQHLEAPVRAGDTVARIGGDEFVVLLDSVESAAHVLTLAERLRAAVAACRVVSNEGLHPLTASIGVAVAEASATSFEGLMRDAGMAMLAVKSGGRNAVQMFEPSMHEQARERLEMQADLGRALERGEFWLLYEPRFDVSSGRLDTFEALVRWSHPARGLVPADQLIALAEESGLIVQLGRWVLGHALAQAGAWTSRGVPRDEQVSIAVNVSTAQLRSPRLLDDVREALERSSIEPARVVLEIAETSLIEDSERVIGVLGALKKLGVRIAIDDFGTGYASLASLRDMPIDILEIDKSLVRSSDDSQRGRDLLEAIMGIARTLSLATVADGIERPAQLAAVRELGCDLAQGYLLGRPLSPEDAQAMVGRERSAEPSSVRQRAGGSSRAPRAR